MSRAYPTRPVVGVLGVVRRSGRILLVQRAREPSLGKWGFPGGIQELGETVFAAVARELAEETGLTVAPAAFLTALDVLDRDEADRIRAHYTLVAVLAEWRSGEVKLDDEATNYGWFTPWELAARDLPLLPDAARIMTLALSHP
jgi:8-oxo-dGTP diphosphatase